MAKKVSKKAEVEEGKVCAFLAYFLIGIIWLLVDEKLRNNSFAKFHVKQALVLLIASIIINVVGSIIPFIGWFIILPVGSLFVLVLWIMGLVYSLQGEMKELPLIGRYGSLFNF